MADGAASGSRPRHRWMMLALLGGAVVLIGAATAGLLTMPTMRQIAPVKLTNDATPTITLGIAHPAGLGADDVSASIDGTPIPNDQVRVLDDGARVEIDVLRLRDGIHAAAVRVQRVGLLRRTLTERFSFTVDTTPPRANIVNPSAGGSSGDPVAYVAPDVAAITRDPLRLVLNVERGATIDVTSSAATARPFRADGADQTRRVVEVALPQGAQTLSIAASDAAGNTTTQSLPVLVDTTGPTLVLRTPRVIRTATLNLPLTARDPLGVQLSVRLDGNDLKDGARPTDVREAPFMAAAAASASDPQIGEGGGDDTPALLPVGDAAPDPAPSGDSEDGDSGTEALPVSGRWSVQVEDGAYEGRHVLEVTGTDSLGRRTKLQRTILVDSTEQLGEAEGLRTGARGADVVQLHAALIKQEVVTPTQLAIDRQSRTYGAQTRAAVQKYQQRQGIDADGIAGGDTIAGLTLRIVIDRAAHTLTLYRLDAVVKSWGIAVGSPQYPTPAGDFQIQTMEKNPTWTPPDSEWAKDAEVTPPGPNNPLGTRWMAVNGTVGIHGTNSPASIGYSVSHGCIRMSIPDVEELYEIVAIGTPVSIV